jgi:beta-lactamase regulating signal transducer with metallopeptidase domain
MTEFVTGLFVRILTMSVMGSIVIAAVLVARLLLRRAPKAFSYALWAVVLLCLLCPFVPKSLYALMPDPYGSSPSASYTYDSPAPPEYAVAVADDMSGAPIIPAADPDQLVDSDFDWLFNAINAVCYTWFFGAVAMLLYAAVTYVLLRRRLRHARTHIRRLDYLVKPLAFFALALHWFNPLVWFAHSLMCRDMEERKV